MRSLVDECTGPAVARWLREQSHDVFSVYDEAQGSLPLDEQEFPYHTKGNRRWAGRIGRDDSAPMGPVTRKGGRILPGDITDFVVSLEHYPGSDPEGCWDIGIRESPTPSAAAASGENPVGRSAAVSDVEKSPGGSPESDGNCLALRQPHFVASYG